MKLLERFAGGRRRAPSNAVHESRTLYVGDPVVERMVRGLDAANLATLEAQATRNVVWGMASDPYNGRAFRGDPGPQQAFKYASIAANPNIARGANQVLPGTSAPPGALNPVLDLLRRTQ